MVYDMEDVDNMMWKLLDTHIQEVRNEMNMPTSLKAQVTLLRLDLIVTAE